MKITGIQTQVKTKGRYSIYIDGVYGFSLSESALVDSKLAIGSEMSSEEVSRLKEVSATDKILHSVYALLARRPRSRWEIQNYLKRKSVAENQIEIILNTLSNKDYIDDRQFARSWVENRRLLKSVSKKRLRLELSAKRVPAQIIDEVLQEDEVNEDEVLRILIQKKRGQSRYKDDIKLMQYLSRQGFGYDDIRRALQEAEKS